MTDDKKAMTVRIILCVCILWSVWMMYYVNIIKQDYVVFTNPEGPTKEE